MEVIKIKEFGGIPDGYTGIAEFLSGTKRWYLNGKLHREDGPAIEYIDSSKAWYLNGRFLFSLPPESQPFILIEEFVDERGEGRIKVLTQTGIEMLPNLPGLKALANSADNFQTRDTP